MRRTSTSLCLVAVLVCLVQLAACSSDRATSPSNASPSGAGSDWDTIITATKAGGGVRTEGSSTPGSTDTRVAGTFSGSSGQVTLPVYVNGVPKAIEVRWTPEKTFVKRIEGTASLDDLATTQAFRTSDQKPWAEVLASARTFLVGGADPFEALNWAKNGNATKVGEEQQNGETWTKYTWDPVKASATVPGALGSARIASLAGKLDLWVDGSNKLRRVRDERSTRTITYDVTALDTAPRVEDPPAGDLQPPATPPKQQPEPVDLASGPYVETTAGTTAGTSWSFLKAPTASDGTCYRLDLRAALGGDPQVGEPFCVEATEPGAALQDQMYALASTATANGVNAVALVLPKDARATQIAFADRSRQPMPDTPDLAVWVGPATPQPVWVGVTAGKDKFGCGAGAVTEVDDLDRMSPEQVNALRNQTWICVGL